MCVPMVDALLRRPARCMIPTPFASWASAGQNGKTPPSSRTLRGRRSTLPRPSTVGKRDIAPRNSSILCTHVTSRGNWRPLVSSPLTQASCQELRSPVTAIGCSNLGGDTSCRRLRQSFLAHARLSGPPATCCGWSPKWMRRAFQEVMLTEERCKPVRRNQVIGQRSHEPCKSQGPSSMSGCTQTKRSVREVCDSRRDRIALSCSRLGLPQLSSLRKDPYVANCAPELRNIESILTRRPAKSAESSRG